MIDADRVPLCDRVHIHGQSGVASPAESSTSIEVVVVVAEVDEEITFEEAVHNWASSILVFPVSFFELRSKHQLSFLAVLSAFSLRSFPSVAIEMMPIVIRRIGLGGLDMSQTDPHSTSLRLPFSLWLNHRSSLIISTMLCPTIFV
jgi:hypothetical protein